MYSLVLIWALNGFLVSGVLGKFLGKELSVGLNLFNIGLLGLSAWWIVYEIGLGQTVVQVNLGSWWELGPLQSSFGFLFDSLTAVMLVIVATVSWFVHVYSVGYMKHDPFLLRFLSYLSLFTFFMLVLITADNFIQMFFGWEGVGVCSYLLIGFWWTRIRANQAALKAMIMNRISDVFFIYGILLLLLGFQTADYRLVFLFLEAGSLPTVSFWNQAVPAVDLIAFFLLVGGIGKSAQLGLHTWLPDAMEGPTPVSSLLHAATMVTAGVFLIIRCSFLFELSQGALGVTMMIGGVTALFASIVGFFQYDLKKVIAYSTCSQLGYMFFSCGLSHYHIAMFHLFNHAFFKALLFLSAGSVIHALVDEQDMRRMGQLVNFLPFTYFLMGVGSLAIMGFPFLTGFYSKDLLLELTFSRWVIDASFIYGLGLTAAFFTALYSVRLLLLVFFNYAHFFRIWGVASESDPEMAVSMVSLGVFSVGIGFVASDVLMGWGSFFWNHSITGPLTSVSWIEAHFLPPLVKNLPVLLSGVGTALGWGLIEAGAWLKSGVSVVGSYFSPRVRRGRPGSRLYVWGRSLSTFFSSALFVNLFYNKVFDALFYYSYELCNKSVDKGGLEWWGPFGFYKGVRRLSLLVKTYPPSVIFFNLGFMFLALSCLMGYLFLGLYVPQLGGSCPGLLGFLGFVVGLSPRKVFHS